MKATIRANAGFSMVEIMVGVLIGMVSTVVIMQVFALSEGQKRTAMGGGEAQTGGAIALQTVQRDLREAGYELGVGSLVTTPIGCDVGLPSGVTLKALAPVTVNHSAFTGANSPDPNTDTLLVVYGSGNHAPDGDFVSGAISPNYAVRSATAFAVNDQVIPSNNHSPANPCGLALTLTTVTAVPCTWSGTPPEPDCPTNDVTVAKWVTSRVLYNLGSAPVVRAYAIRGGRLTVCNYMVNDCGNSALKNTASVWVPIADNIVSLKAQYGRDTKTPSPPPAAQGNYLVDTYDQTTPTTSCGWLRVPALRLALVARSVQYEKDIVTNTALNSGPPNAPTWAGNATDAIIADPSPLGPDKAADEPWKHYRYKVFETVVPIRTMTYVQAQSPC